MKKRNRIPGALGAWVVGLVALGCGKDPVALDFWLGPAVAEPLVFHGNCFAGWLVRVDLTVRETAGADVLLESLSYRLVDEGIGEESPSGSRPR